MSDQNNGDANGNGFLPLTEREANEAAAYAAAGWVVPDMSGVISPMGMGGMDQKANVIPSQHALFILGQLKANVHVGGGLKANGIWIGGNEGAIICVDMRSDDPSKSRMFEVKDFLEGEELKIFSIWAAAYSPSKHDLPDGAMF